MSAISTKVGGWIITVDLKKKKKDMHVWRESSSEWNLNNAWY